jgi:5-methyltetrahydrofolate--homocysteine methyltransferase
MNIEMILPWVNKKFLYHSLWQIKADQLARDSELLTQLEQKYQQMAEVATEIVVPAATYTFYHANICNENMIVYPSFRQFTINPAYEYGLPMSTTKISQSLLSPNVALQVVSIGQKPVDHARKLKESGSYQDYFYWHGFCAALTEALAARLHAMIRVEKDLESAENQSPESDFKKEYPGKRISFGYEALPVLNEQRKVLELLNANTLGITMTESGMLDPEYSTCAIVILV